MNTFTESEKEQVLATAVSEFVPHSDPMVLINRIQDFSENTLSAEVDISATSRFYDDTKQGVETWVAIEYMAQAVAAFAGVKARLSGNPVKLGFLLGTRRMLIHETVLKANRTYQIDITELFMDDSGLGAFRCQLKHQDTVISEAKLNVFETNDTNQLLDD